MEYANEESIDKAIRIAILTDKDELVKLLAPNISPLRLDEIAHFAFLTDRQRCLLNLKISQVISTNS